MSHSLLRQGFGFGAGNAASIVAKGPNHSHQRLGENDTSSGGDDRDSFRMFHPLNIMGQDMLLKKRSATIHYRSTIRDKIQEEDHRHQQSDGKSRNYGAANANTGGIKQQLSRQGSSSNNSNIRGHHI